MTSLTLNNVAFKVRTFGDELLLLRAEQASAGELACIGKAILAAKLGFVDEVIASEFEICLRLNSTFTPEAIDQLSQLTIEVNGANRTWKVPVCFESGVDWSAVEQNTGIDRETYIDHLLNASLNVAMLGFLPGFVYLNGLPDALQCPRKAEPEPVAANTFAVGGGYAGIYALPSPGGWFRLGTIAVTMSNFDELPPLPMMPRDAVVIDRIDPSQLKALQSSGATLEQYSHG